MINFSSSLCSEHAQDTLARKETSSVEQKVNWIQKVDQVWQIGESCDEETIHPKEGNVQGEGGQTSSHSGT